jgi:hypothetical protein
MDQLACHDEAFNDLPQYIRPLQVGGLQRKQKELVCVYYRKTM